MRKQITQEANVSNSAITQNGGGSQMENLLKFYAKTFKRMSYRKDADTDRTRMDYMECLQEVIANYLENKPEVNNLKYYILRAAKNEMKDRYKKESRMDITDENFEAEIYCFNLGEVIAANEAIQKLLTVTEYEVITLYGQGFTLDEIAVKIEVNKAEQVRRILFRARSKVDSLKMEAMYDSKVAQYQGKQGKADIKYRDTIYDEKLDTYKAVKHNPSEVINRRFICLDQSKVKTQLLPADYSGNLCPCRKEVITEIASDTDKNKYEVKTLNGQYMGSRLPDFETNKEVIQLFHNRSEYNKMIRSNSIVVKEKRSNPVFTSTKYMDTTGKFRNI
jgi:DNA-directed RNA polymerase specialized sigma24 family protein